jgi:transcriptional regulator with XRE-family HTH domain
MTSPTAATSLPPDAADLAQLGAFVRSRRRAARLSMQDLADLAGRGRSTVHRLEYGPAAKAGAVSSPNACAVATVLAALRVSPAEARQVIGDGRWTDEVARWLALLAPPATAHDLTALGELVSRRRVAAGAARAAVARRCDILPSSLLLLEQGAMAPDRGAGPALLDAACVGRVLAFLSVTVEDVAPLLGADAWADDVLRALADAEAPTEGRTA